MILDKFINYNVDAVILANGEYPTTKNQLDILKNNKYLICCDGAINSLMEKDPSIVPNIIIGDCDSMSIKNKERFSDIVHHVHDQSINDLTKAVRHAVSLNKKNILILGATGKREDHTIANISLLTEYANYTNNVSMITDHGIFNPQKKGSKSYVSYKGQQVSFFCISPATINVRNMLYKCENLLVKSWWEASLNEATDNLFNVDTDGDIVIFRVF